MGSGMSRATPAESPRWPTVAIAAATVAIAVVAIALDRGRLPARPLAPRVIDLDRADAVDLDLLPGIGPALAARIIDDREANGPFGSPDGLRRVRGIGPAIVEGIRPHVRVASPADRDDG